MSGCRGGLSRIACCECWTPTTAAGALDFQKLPHVLQCLVQSPLKGTAAWPRADEAQLVLQPSIGYLQIGPAQHVLAPKHRHRIMAHAALVGRNIRLQLVLPFPKQLEAPAIPDHGVKGRQEA